MVPVLCELLLEGVQLVLDEHVAIPEHIAVRRGGGREDVGHDTVGSTPRCRPLLHWGERKWAPNEIYEYWPLREPPLHAVGAIPVRATAI